MDWEAKGDEMQEGAQAEELGLMNVQGYSFLWEAEQAEKLSI
jgi:hypothetical protein